MNSNRRLTVGLAIALGAACSGSKTAPQGPGVDSSAGRTGGRAGHETGSGGGSGSGGEAGTRGEVDAATGGMADAARDAGDASGLDLRAVRDATPLPDGPYRYPDPAGALCGDTKHTLAKTPAQVVLVLDRSTSMLDVAVPPASKWQDATAAVEDAMAANPNIAWGIKMFPTTIPGLDPFDHDCEVTPELEVPPGFGTPAAIAAAMDRTPPPYASGTPTDRAMNVAAGFLQKSTTPLPKYIVLVTDGVPNCTGDGKPDKAIKAIAGAAAAGIPTFVLGIFEDDDQAIATLDKMAEAGGKPRVGLAKFYPAVSRAQLDAALAAITLAITNCVFPLAVPPLDPGFVGVTVDGQLIPRDPAHAQGWDYVMNGKGVEIFGAACTDLKKGTALSVGIHYGCPK
jgi:hypothetical protein